MYNLPNQQCQRVDKGLPEFARTRLLGRFQRPGQQRTGRSQIRADELVAGVGRRDPYGAVETVTRMREGIEGVRIEACAGLGRGESSNRRPRRVRVVL